MMNNNFSKKRKKKLHVSQQEINNEVNPHKQIKKESDDEKELKSSYNNDLKSSNPDTEAEVVYFEKILDILKTGVPDESRDLFVSNALEECKGKEITLSCHPGTSRCIESLLLICTDNNIWRQFMASFLDDKETVCTNPSASHIVELLIRFAVKNMKNWSSALEANSDEGDIATYSLMWIVEFCNFVLENFASCLGHQHAAHIAASVIRAVGGDMSASSDYMSRKLNKNKKDLSLFDTTEDSALDSISKEEIILESIPKELKEKLKLITKCVRKIENISDYVSESYGALVIEALICILCKRIPKQSRKLIKALAVNLFAEKDDNDVSVAFLQKNPSFVIEKMFETADEDLQTLLWNQYVHESFEHLSTHQISNYIIQRFFNSVKSPTLLQIMSERAGSFFTNIIQAEKFGILLSIASACIRLKAHQALFMKNLMQCLECAEPPEKQLKLVPLLLNFNKYNDSEYVKNAQLFICLQGSLLIQKLLTFQKPIKLVNSLLDMKPQSLVTLACHLQGCHVLNSFFKSDTVGEKSKDKLVHSLQPVVASIACDENGNLTLSRIWVLLSLKQKGVIANVLAKNEEKLKSSRKGNIVFNKFKIFQYKRSFEQWKEFQLKFLDKKKEQCK